MSKRSTKRVCRVLFIGICLWGISPVQTFGALIYKNYLVRQDKGVDILCDSYAVKPGDWVFKIFRQRGEISQKDFFDFIRIFKRLNPGVRDINLLRPGQIILIPLKKTLPGTYVDNIDGIVTIPFVTLTKPEKAKSTAPVRYTVKKGDSVSRLLVTHFVKQHSQPLTKGIAAFKTLNPDIADLNRLYAGQKIWLPGVDKADIPARVPAESKMISDDIESSASGTTAIETTLTPNSRPPNPNSNRIIAREALSIAALALEAKLLDKGKYFFPRDSMQDLVIDLSRIPIIEMKDKTRIFIQKGFLLKASHSRTIQSFWPHAYFIAAQLHPSVKGLMTSIFRMIPSEISKARTEFAEPGMVVKVQPQWGYQLPASGGEKGDLVAITLIEDRKQQTDSNIIHYLATKGVILKDILPADGEAGIPTQTQNNFYPVTDVSVLDGADLKRFVRELFLILGYSYSEDSHISFPYAGIQINAVSNLVSKKDGNPLIVDFGTFYGEAVDFIRKAGFEIVQIKAGEKVTDNILKLLKALDETVVQDPVFLAANRPLRYNTVVTIKGILIDRQAKPLLLVPTTKVNDLILRYLNKKGIRVAVCQDPLNSSENGG